MRKLVYVLLALVLVCACNGSKTEQQAGKVANPLWGMWLEQESPSDEKWEIMFNEDSTGFVFVDDKFYSRTLWTQDSLLRVKFEFADKATGEQVFKVKIVSDTLWLRGVCANDGDDEDLRYIRVKG